MNKQCFKCLKTKPISMFYRHKMMADGHLNKCIECAKSDSKQRLRNSPEIVSAYEAKRNNKPERKAKLRAVSYRWRKQHPEANRAHSAVAYALKKGRLTRQPCKVCGKRAHAHHDDYSRPLDVEWLCPMHHQRTHHDS